ncbi:low molecular weight phosphatase family protein [Acrocarpospora phusangensis]|uniref:Low molecular weight phosphatase family protein n=1 Tax=Acrocarpospora phusangensis TaxID=1070424 RepID=A0A919Q7R9_9ACTN|nr:low molecular weight phosphatase family protein [Acrocarpospora phusangensis]
MLYVCTGNICRSPIAECLTRTALAAVPGVEVGSAGTRTVAGVPISAGAREVLRLLGTEAGEFVSRPLGAEMVEEADLVLTATRRHRAEVVTRVPASMGRVFTIGEFGALVRAVPEALVTRFLEVGERGRALLAEATARRGVVRVADPDVIDPIGRSGRVYRAVGRRIAAELSVPLRLLAGGTESGGDRS